MPLIFFVSPTRSFVSPRMHMRLAVPRFVMLLMSIPLSHPLPCHRFRVRFEPWNRRQQTRRFFHAWECPPHFPPGIRRGDAPLEASSLRGGEQAPGDALGLLHGCCNGHSPWLAWRLWPCYRRECSWAFCTALSSTQTAA